MLTELEALIRRINRTNATVDMGPDGTLTDALARRDALRLRHAVLTVAADATPGGARQLKCSDRLRRDPDPAVTGS